MRLYYMTAQKWALKILQERRLKVSLIEDANDPHELLGATIGEKKARGVFKSLHTHWKKTMGMLCMTTDWSSPVMWAHYADKHHGICLGFDVPDHVAKAVDYSPSKINFVLDLQHRTGGITPELIEAVLLTKYLEWKYENEHRVFVNLNEVDPDNKYYHALGPEVTLREVVIGHRCKLTTADIRKHVGEVERSVAIYKVRPAFDSFAMVLQKQVARVTVPPKRRPR